MGKLRKFEIEAIVDTIKTKIKTHNEGITVSDTEINTALRNDYPKVIEYRKNEVKVRELNNKNIKLSQEIKEEYGNGTYVYQHVRAVEDRVKDSILKSKGAKVLDEAEITNKIIIAGSSGNLEEIITNLTEDLGL